MTTHRLLRIKAVQETVSLSKSYIYGLCRDGKFPAPVQLVPGGDSVAWVESEIQAWIEERITARDSKDNA